MTMDRQSIPPETTLTGSFEGRRQILGWITRWHLIFLAQVLDMVVIVSTAMLAYPVTGINHGEPPLRYIIGAATVAFISHFSFLQARLYELEALRNPLRALKSLAGHWTVIFLLCAALAALTHDPNSFSRLWYAGFFAGGMAALCFERLMLKKIIDVWIAEGHHALTVAIVGVNELSVALIKKLHDKELGIRIAGVFDDRKHDRITELTGVPFLGTIADFLKYSQTHEVDTVVIALPIAASARILAVIRQLRQRPVNVRVLPGPIGLERMSPLRLAKTELPGVQLIAVAERPISEVALITKTLFDRFVAAVVLIMASPILLCCAACIKLSSPGPVLFVQKRVGYKGCVFNIYKFRTMHFEACGSEQQAVQNDSRVFRFGRFLRKTSLDELPQLLNVLRGEMSIVGPRPHVPEGRAAGHLYVEAVAEYADRQRVKPGITGWAQVNGWRGPTETVAQIEKRVEFDTYYIDNWSIVFDLIIILKTLGAVIHGKNAF